MLDSVCLYAWTLLVACWLHAMRVGTVCHDFAETFV
jgi:hypothetical protein